jgi:hypothetical protein
MANERPNQSGGENNLLVAICGLTIAAGLTAVASAYIAEYVISTMGDSNSMALLLGANKIASDSVDLERQLNTAQAALRTVRDLGMALGVGSLGVGAAVIMRVLRRRSGQKAA